MIKTNIISSDNTQEEKIKKIRNSPIFILSNKKPRIYENYIIRNVSQNQFPYRIYFDKNLNYEIENAILKDYNHFNHFLCYRVNETDNEQIYVEICPFCYYHFVNVNSYGKYQYGSFIDIDRIQIKKINNVSLKNIKINYQTKIFNAYFYPQDGVKLLKVKDGEIRNDGIPLTLFSSKQYIIQVIDANNNSYFLYIKPEENITLQPFQEIYPNFPIPNAIKYILGKEIPNNNIFIAMIFSPGNYNNILFSKKYIQIPKDIIKNNQFKLLKNIEIVSIPSNNHQYFYVPFYLGNFLFFPINENNLYLGLIKKFDDEPTFIKNQFEVILSLHNYDTKDKCFVEDGQIKSFCNFQFHYSDNNLIPIFTNLEFFVRHQILKDWDYIIYYENQGDIHLSLNRDYTSQDIDFLRGVVYVDNDQHIIDTVIKYLASEYDNFYPLFIVLNKMNDEIYSQILTLREKFSIYSLVFVCDENIKYPNEVDDLWHSSPLSNENNIITFEIIDTIHANYDVSEDERMILLKEPIPNTVDYIALNIKNTKLRLYKRYDYGNYSLWFEDKIKSNEYISYPLPENHVVLLKQITKYQTTSFNFYYKIIHTKSLDKYIKEVKKIEDDYISYYESSSFLKENLTTGYKENKLEIRKDTGFKFIDYRIRGYENVIRHKNLNQIYNYDNKYQSYFDAATALQLRKNGIDIFNAIDNYPGITSTNKNQLLMFLIVYLSYLEWKTFSKITRRMIINHHKTANNINIIMENIKKQLLEITNSNLIDMKWRFEIIGEKIVIYNYLNFRGKKEVEEIKLVFNIRD